MHISYDLEFDLDAFIRDIKRRSTLPARSGSHRNGLAAADGAGCERLAASPARAGKVDGREKKRASQ
jgi:hypothetical protein